MYVEEGVFKKRVKLRDGGGLSEKLSLDDVVGVLRDAECAVGFVVDEGAAAVVVG
ncbi:MAG: hypothetical protein FWB84_08080 [Candidatus Bathyarchaeota archaeon]|uniref:hypothetical protein n=1 Tax=Candidatus Bathycorpusculum sp. TaxID=2994959 RepID=UPI002836C786|nr:hypothetical protein [Candidatus Termiticorpusculum sp.]